MDRVTNLQSLLAFVTVAREGSVSAAAERLNLTQPAVSHQIKRLSREIDVVLFRRISNGLHLTPEGEHLLPKAEAALAAVSEFHKTAVRQSSRITGKVRIGTIIDPDFIRLGPTLSRFKNDYPDVEVELIHGISGQTLSRLKRDEIDAGFYLCAPDTVDQIALDTDTPLEVQKLADFNYRIVGPAGWDDKLRGADWPELAALPWIGTPPMSVHHRLLKPIFEQQNLRPTFAALVDQEASMLEMVRSGIGLSLSRDAIALEQKQSAGLSICPDIIVPACLCYVAHPLRGAEAAKHAFSETVRHIW